VSRAESSEPPRFHRPCAKGGVLRPRLRPRHGRRTGRTPRALGPRRPGTGPRRRPHHGHRNCRAPRAPGPGPQPRGGRCSDRNPRAAGSYPRPRGGRRPSHSRHTGRATKAPGPHGPDAGRRRLPTPSAYDEPLSYGTAPPTISEQTSKEKATHSHSRWIKFGLHQEVKHFETSDTCFSKDRRVKKGRPYYNLLWTLFLI